MAKQDDPKPGIKTTEFYTTIGGALAVFAASQGLIPEDSQGQVTVMLGTLFGLVAIVANYVMTRQRSKEVHGTRQDQQRVFDALKSLIDQQHAMLNDLIKQQTQPHEPKS